MDVNEQRRVMDPKIVKSGIAHSVVISEVTKNAINPRNHFMEVDEAALAESERLSMPHGMFPHATATAASGSDAKPIQTPAHVAKTEVYSARETLTEPKPHVTQNFQKLDAPDATRDEKFYESLHRIEDRLHRLRAEHPRDNLQHIQTDANPANHQAAGSNRRYTDNIQNIASKKRYVDNWQKTPSTVQTDNLQDVGPVEKIEQRFEYKEKNNLKDVMVAVPSRDGAPLSGTRPAAELSPNAPSSPDASTGLLTGELSTLDEDDLRARLREIKIKLENANQSLKKIADENSNRQD